MPDRDIWKPLECLERLYFFPTSAEIVLGATLYIHVGICLAMRTTTGIAIFGTTLFYMFAKIIPNFKIFKLIFPIGYKEVLDVTSHPYLFSFTVSIVIYAIYHFVFYQINKKTFINMQFN